MTLRLTLGAAALGLFVSLPSRAADAPPLPDRAAVLATVQRSAAAEIARLRASDGGRRGIDNTWVSAAFMVGTTRLADVTEDPDVVAFNLKTARGLDYAHQGPGAPVHLINADDQAIGALYQWGYQRGGAPGALLPLKQRLDYTVPYLRMDPAPAKLVWWWCDALFMAPPILVKMSALTGDPKYIDAMDVQFWRVHDRLYNREDGLFARDERFIGRRSANGKKIYWARGEGWVLAGLARVLETMPAGYPSRPRYVALFQDMAKRIAALQQPDGLWRASLYDVAAHPEPEASGTAFFAYALAFGINHGLLDRAAYQPAVTRAWAGLNRYLLPNGILGQVQTTGDQPVPTKRETTALYASGAFILAGLEVADLGRPVTPLPLPLRMPPALKYEAANWGSKQLPANPTAQQLKDYQRNEEERQAVATYSFDPVLHDPHYQSPVKAP